MRIKTFYKYSIILHLLFCFAFNNAAGQQIVQKTFSETIETPQYLISTADGGLLISGSSGSFTSLASGLLLKLDSSGNFQWAKIITEPSGQYHSEISKIIQLSNFNYICYGISYLPNGYNAFQWIMYLDNFGNILNQKCIRLNQGAWLGFYDIIENPNGGFTICGVNDYGFSPTGFNERKLLLMTFDLSLNSLWAKEYHYHYAEEFRTIKHSTDNQFLLQAYTWDSLPPARGDIAIFKIDNAGNLQWAKQCGDSVPGSIFNPSSHFGDLEILPNGSMYNSFTTNWFNSFNFQYLLMQELDSSGNEIQSKHFYYAGVGEWKILVYDSNSLYLHNGSWLMKLDSNLNIFWRKYIKPTAITNWNLQSSLIKTNLGGMAFSCRYYSNTPANLIYFSLIDSTGDIGCNSQILSTPIAQQKQVPMKNITSFITQNFLSVLDSSLTYTSQDVTIPDSVFCDTGTSINVTNNNSKIEILPNPTQDYIWFKPSFNINNTVIDIYDVTYTKVTSVTVVSDKISVSKLKSGIYFLVLKLNDSQTVFKIIKY